MISITPLLLSNDNFYATLDDKVNFGASSDKQWLHSLIKNKNILVGRKTYDTIKNKTKLLSLAKTWLIYTSKQTENHSNQIFTNKIDNNFVEINFGGLQTIINFPTDLLIIHKTYNNINRGKKFPVDFLEQYKKLYEISLTDYKEMVYKK